MNFNFEILDKCRLRSGDYGSNPKDTFGAFNIPKGSHILRVLASDGEGFEPRWEHVSVSLPNRCPNWLEMCYVKQLFWSEDETVIQYHPKGSDYINTHPNCLHLWRKYNKDFELPPMIYV